ncbi:MULTISPECIES: tRNA (adenosine(37)-N6)-threonylcarbamoyltransferase complex ATPase subunit type 1 TsaE [Vagococcus]|uniref:tRNA threonylcarbamoyladenosine biosynthesis protein TsaE n=1 Tax=Vagococcus fluvialis bH819 TaxID=1255619 RepID=A0A1X6WLA1_9ENTE|nr:MULTISPECIES: tRNA (adenosine(37)-N6)-threonylcarbamoyltransferase complex ATPase subunit type 1 TsaE [Vagococcus]SLM85045.1 TsaE protein, required for threonylcarbamoyladenosine t(6)A37 formation in tRNA [Vagococcus fluvialis bH819]HCM88539.1 tRNA (adenosine(37)-N6)-threonylcarbamoyltransferase complex ATPase subunit type 1 TsaE [Vagococcus sp.]
MKKIQLRNEEETKKLAFDIASLSQKGDIFLLTGELGAGKTTFTKGFAQGLGIEQMIKSPTYTLIREYDTGRLPLYHMDVYRLTEGATDLGLDEYLEGDGVCVIEWGQMIIADIFSPYIELFLDKVSNEERAFHMRATSPSATEKMKQLQINLSNLGWDL